MTTIYKKEDVVKDVRAIYEDKNREIEKLKQENEKLRECVEFYANKDNWSDNDLFGCPSSIIGDSEYGKETYEYKHKYQFSKHLTLGGKKARQTLKDLEHNQ